MANDPRLGTQDLGDLPFDAPARSPRTEAKRQQIIDTAMRTFAENGYQGARVEDIASELGIAKGSVFQYFGTKEGLFLAAYRQALLTSMTYFDAPEETLDAGFFATIRYWLNQTEHLVREDWIPYRVLLIGNYGTDLRLKREINRLLADDPYGTVAFVKYGLETGEVREDIEQEMLVSIVDWLMERFQDALVTEELDPGLFHRRGDTAERREQRIEQFIELIRSAVGSDQAKDAAASKS
ncbi:MAG: TetR/AcrR family transcriptional regulator [Actinomycetota bacterium]